MRLFLNGNYIQVRRVDDLPYTEYRITVQSGNGEVTVISVNPSTITKMRDQISELLEVD